MQHVLPEDYKMSHLTPADKTFFKENGYLVKHNTLTQEQIRNAQDALWEGIQADRSDPATWINAQPRSPVPGNHPALRATLHESPIFAMAKEMVGKDLLAEGANPGPALVYPTGKEQWSLSQHGHLDGYYTPTNGVPEGTVGTFTIGATIYVEKVEHRGGGFTVWPGSHAAAAAYFKTHSLLSLNGGDPSNAFDSGAAVEITGAAGTVCFWHGQLVHTGSQNCSRTIRMALIARMARQDLNDSRFETPDDMWHDWEGMG
jgi:hypothetical protein